MERTRIALAIATVCLLIIGCPDAAIPPLEESTPDAPSAPTVETPTENSLTVSWPAIEDAVSYNVYRDTSPTGGFTLLVYTGTASTFTDTGLAGGTTYYYSVSAVNASGESEKSTVVSATTLSHVVGSPANIVVDGATTESITVSWDAVAGATGYELYRDTSAAGSFSLKVYAGASILFADQGLLDGTMYYYKVRAMGASGPGALSSPHAGATLMVSVFVSPGGTDGNPGTRDHPVRTIGRAAAIAAATSGITDIRIASGTYSETVTVVNGVSLHGGLSAATWLYDASGLTEIAPPSSVSGDSIAVTAHNISASCVLEDLTIVSANATTPGASSYGVHLNEVANMTLIRLVISAGNGASGAAGQNGTAGEQGSNGSPGGPGDPDDDPPGNGGAGGAGASISSGGTGGKGGAAGEYNGMSGSPGAGGAAGGTGGGYGDPGDPGSAGANGSTGTAGSSGSGGSGGTVPSDKWLSGSGGNGIAGGYGGGGGGGGGGGAQTGSFVQDGAGNGGGGGGAGGGGGSGGMGGTGGGGSFCLFIVSSAGITVQDCVLTGSDGGNGGGGGNGGTGGGGGLPGQGAQESTDQIGAGGKGGNGGVGGSGGPGGGGAGGPSYTVYKYPGSTTVTLTGCTCTPGSGGAGGDSASNDGQAGASGAQNW